jgi:hypothetical protein
MLTNFHNQRRAKMPFEFDLLRLDDYGEVYRFSESPTRLRFLGPVSSYASVWFRIRLPGGRTFGIEKLCLDWDAKEDDFVRKVCPYRRAGLHVQTNYVSNAIIRSLQAAQPGEVPKHIASERRDEFWFKKFRLLPWKSWTPVRLVRVPPSLADKLAKESRHHGDLADSTHGGDVKIRYLEHETPALKYSLRVGKRTRLTREELDYVRFPVAISPKESVEEAEDQWARLQPFLVRRRRGN